jgi:hypothetical protein
MIEGVKELPVCAYPVGSEWRRVRLDRWAGRRKTKSLRRAVRVFNRGFSVGYAKERVGREMLVIALRPLPTAGGMGVCAYRRTRGSSHALCRPI